LTVNAAAGPLFANFPAMPVLGYVRTNYVGELAARSLDVSPDITLTCQRPEDAGMAGAIVHLRGAARAAARSPCSPLSIGLLR
jgi:hypothetical protein